VFCTKDATEIFTGAEDVFFFVTNVDIDESGTALERSYSDLERSGTVLNVDLKSLSDDGGALQGDTKAVSESV